MEQEKNESYQKEDWTNYKLERLLTRCCRYQTFWRPRRSLIQGCWVMSQRRYTCSQTTNQFQFQFQNNRGWMVCLVKKTHSLKEMRPSLSTSKSMKNSDGEHLSSPGFLSPVKYPSLTRWDSDGGNTGTIALIKSAGFISNSPFDVRTDAKYSKT